MRARFAVPYEIALGLGFSQSTWLPITFRDAWLLTGNSLSLAHAALQCTRTQWLVGDASGLASDIQGVFDICRKVLENVCKMDGLETKVDGDWMVLGAVCERAPASIPLTVVTVDDDLDGGSELVMPRDIPPTVSPTVPFEGIVAPCEAPCDPVLCAGALATMQTSGKLEERDFLNALPIDWWFG